MISNIPLGLALLMSLTATTIAQENQELGRMWTFESPPLAYLEDEYGFMPDQAWLDALRLGSLRLGRRRRRVLLRFGVLRLAPRADPDQQSEPAFCDRGDHGRGPII